MSLILLNQKTATRVKTKKIFQNLTFLLAMVFLWEVRLPEGYTPRSHSAVNAAPVKKLEATSNKTELKTKSESVFGEKGQNHWYIQGAAATTLDRNQEFPQRFGLAGAGISHFLFNGHSVNLELNSLYLSQPGDDALGLNLALLMRWHFLRQSNWSLFVDGGAGIMGTTSDVPNTGASFNFTPQAGAGTTIKLNKQRRLMLGLRWHHISHADLLGANPGRDSLMGYVGIRFPR